MTVNSRDLILASSSVYRKQLLSQLGLNFRCDLPDVDESPRKDEPAELLARRLALTKANRILTKNPSSLVIGSDQVADLGGKLLGKPMDRDRALDQLRACSGKTVYFYTALAVVSAASEQVDCVTTEVRFRSLTPTQIEFYIKKEEPLDCAGSFKCEGLGIALFESIGSDDPSALIGLPLIKLVSMLRNEGIDPLSF